MSKQKRTENEGYISCPFEEEDILSEQDYHSLFNSTSTTSQNSKKSGKISPINKFYFQSKDLIIRFKRGQTYSNFSRK
jgi:hypothetical protein